MPSPELSDLTGTWAHSNGGLVEIEQCNQDLVINNPHTGQPPARIPATSFLQPDGLRYFQHSGTLAGDVIDWSNGSTWTKLAPHYLVVYGKVQNVMFRQTLIRAMQRRGLRGGATNHARDSDRVDLTILGGDAAAGDIIQALRQGGPLNSWGAQVRELEEHATGISLLEHQVSTSNVDEFSWNPNVEMYI